MYILHVVQDFWFLIFCFLRHIIRSWPRHTDLNKLPTHFLNLPTRAKSHRCKCRNWARDHEVANEAKPSLTRGEKDQIRLILKPIEGDDEVERGMAINCLTHSRITVKARVATASVWSTCFLPLTLFLGACSVGLRLWWATFAIALKDVFYLQVNCHLWNEVTIPQPAPVVEVEEVQEAN